MTGFCSGNGLIEENNIDDVSVVVPPALIVGNPVDDVSVDVKPALIGGNTVDDVSVDVTTALIGGNPDDVDDWKFCCPGSSNKQISFARAGLALEFLRTSIN
jgi:hypothetical protein